MKYLILLFALMPLLLQGQQLDTTVVLPEMQVIGWATSSAPISLTNLEKAQIELLNRGQDASQVLSYTPSIQYYTDSGNPYIGYNYYRLRGIDQTRISMSLNGIPLNEPEDMGVYFGNFPDFLSSVSAVQIQRGAGQSFWGSPSYAGNVNFVITPRGKDTGGTLELQSGSWGSHRVSSVYNVDEGFIRGSYLSTNGYRDNSWSDSFSLFGGHQINNWNIIGFLGNQKNGMAYLAISESDLKANRRTNYLSPKEDDSFTQFHIQAIKHLNTQKSVGLFYTRLFGNYDIDFGDPDLWNFRLSSHWLGALFTQSWNDRWEWGINSDLYFRDHSAFAPNKLYDNLGTKLQGSTFLKANHNISSDLLWTNSLSVRGVIFNYTDSELSKDYNWLFLNPSTGLTWKNYFISASLTSREPTRNDLFAGYDDLSPQNVSELSKVSPERAFDFESGFRSKKLKVTLFWMQFKNEIAPIGELSAIGLPLRKNVDQSYRRGLELETDFNVVGGNLAILDANIKSYTDEASGDTFKNVTPLLSPKASGNLWVQQSNQLIGFKFSSESYLTNSNDIGATLPAHTTLWLKLQKTIGKAKISLDVDNLLNQEYFLSGYRDGNENYYFVAASRTIMLGVSYDFSN